MSIESTSSEIDVRSGDAIERVVLNNNEFESVTIRRQSDQTVTVSAETNEGETKTFTFELLDKAFDGLAQEGQWLPTQLREILFEVGYAVEPHRMERIQND